MFISKASLDSGIDVSVGLDPVEAIRVQFGADLCGFAIYFSRVEALELMSGLEKAVHQTAKEEVL